MTAWRDPGDERSWNWRTFLFGKADGPVPNRVYYTTGALTFYVDADSQEEAEQVAQVIAETAEKHGRKVTVGLTQ